MWISKYTIPASESAQDGADGAVDVREAVRQAIKALSDGSNEYELPEIVNVETEWTGYRAGVNHTAKRLDISEREQYEKQAKDGFFTAPPVFSTVSPAAA